MKNISKSNIIIFALITLDVFDREISFSNYQNEWTLMRSNYARPWLNRGTNLGVIALQEAPRCRCWCTRGVHTTDARYTTAKKRRSRSSGDP